MDIYEAYGELKARGLTRDQYDFSRTWLGRDRSYLSSLKARKRPASSETMIHLATALTRAMVAARAERQMEQAETLDRISGSVWQGIFMTGASV